MKKKNQRNKQKQINNSAKKTNIIISILVFTILLFMSSGYALLNTKLTITGKSKLDIPDYNVYVSDASTEVRDDGASYTSWPTHTDNEVGLYTTFTKPSAYAVYKVTIKNTGASDAIVDSIYTTCNRQNIMYRVMSVHPGTVIKAMSEYKTEIMVLPNENVDSINTDSSLLINFNFVKKTSSYSTSCTLNWDGSSSSQPNALDIYGKKYYQVANANELNWVKNQIESGNTGINVMLTNDICMNGKSFSIGKEYTGVFDGQNRTIQGIVYTRNTDLEKDNTYSTGMFTSNAGVIKNLNVNMNITDQNIARTSVSTINLGGITTNNSGIIENVSFNGSIKANEQAIVNCLVKQAHNNTVIGGVAAQNTGIVRGAVNRSTMEITSYASYSVCDVYTRDVTIYSGGIVGVNNGYVSDSYSRGPITTKASTRSDTRSKAENFIGGVIGNHLKECYGVYTSGKVTEELSGVTGNSAYGVIGTGTGKEQWAVSLAGTWRGSVYSGIFNASQFSISLISKAFVYAGDDLQKLFWED